MIAKLSTIGRWITKMGIYSAVVCIAVGLLATAACAAPPAIRSAWLHESKIATDGDLLLIDVKRGERTYRFVVDTGASDTVIDSVTFKDMLSDDTTKLSFDIARGGVQVQKIRNTNDFFVGGSLPIRSSHLHSLNMGQFSALHGAKLDGIVGCDFLSDYCVQFDFDAASLRIGKRNPMAETDRYPISWDQGRRPFVSVTKMMPPPDVGKSRLFLIDTGAFGAHALCLEPKLFQSALEQRMLSLEGNIPGVDVTGRNQARLGQLQGFVLWSKEPHEFRVVENRAADTNLLALQFLRQFNFVIDFPNSQICVQDRKDKVQFSDWKDKSGLRLLRYATDLIVDEARPQSPASLAGIQKGDVVESVNGKPAEGYRLTPLRLTLCEEGKTIRLVMRREAKTWTVDLVLRDWRKPATAKDFE